MSKSQSTYSGKDILLKQYQFEVDTSFDNVKKYNEFKDRITKFEEIKTLDEAKSLASEILPVANEINVFNIGSAKCYVINREDNLRITLDSINEFISYDFV